MWLVKGDLLPPRGLPTALLVLVDVLLCLVCPSGGQGPDGVPRGQGCPSMCFCNIFSKITYCSRRGLATIPRGIPEITKQLNMNGNAFHNPALQRENFTRLGDLEHLYVSECGIETIAENTFIDMDKLSWLDLSNNRIKLVPDFTFRGLTLQHLFLNGNRNIQLRPLSFEGLVTTGLYLHDCGVTTLKPEVLSPLNSTLRYLWLNGNELERIDKNFLSLFTPLSHVRLGNNPLHCSCEFKWLKELFDKNAEIFKGAVAPSCLTPPHMKGKSFEQLEAADFRCQPPFFNNIDANFHDNHGRLKCTASGDPAPFLYWIQPSGKATKYDPPPTDNARKTVGQLLLNSEEGSDRPSLRGMYICVASNEAGNVNMTINVTWPGHVRHETVTYRPVGVTTITTTTTVAPPHNDAPRPSQSGGVRVSQPPAGLPAREDSPDYPGKGEPPEVLYPDRSVSREGWTKSPNAALNDVKSESNTTTGEEKLFSLLELVCAVLGTFICTLLLCLVLLPLYLRQRWTSDRDLYQPNLSVSNTYEKHPMETMQLKGFNYNTDYMDIPTPIKR